MRKKESAGGPSQRQLRVAEEIRHIIGHFLSRNELFIEGLKSSYLMVTEVRISPDFSYAKIFIRGIGGVDTKQQVALLNDHKGVFRFKLGKSIRLRIVPDLNFREDISFEESQHMADLLNSKTVRADVHKKNDNPEDA
ncbi:MAG: 30S ribosome-binding factor RbfA [Lactobacillales bacterium]|jgi:ribosome-binding factor A|nr:30S ribosome-binding factor RbfA [Lactobacillales bacterium]